MHIPQLSIGEIMCLVGLIAVDCWAFSLLVHCDGPSYELYRFLMALVVTLPMTNALAIGVYIVFKGRLRKQPLRPFLAGFVVAGTVTLVVAAMVTAIFPTSVEDHAVMILDKPVTLLVGRNSTPVGQFIDITAFMVGLAIPQFILAMAGGLISRHYGIKLMIENRRRSLQPDPPAMSAVS